MQFTKHCAQSGEKAQGIHESPLEGAIQRGLGGSVPAGTQVTGYSPAQPCLGLGQNLTGHFVALVCYVKPEDRSVLFQYCIILGRGKKINHLRPFWTT